MPLLVVKQRANQPPLATIVNVLAKLKKKLLEDEDGPRGAEDDEGLTAEEAEDRPCQGRAQEALHHPLQERTGNAVRNWDCAPERRLCGTPAGVISTLLFLADETMKDGEP